jgi:N-acyl-D-amino-acid deacylase
LIELSRVVGRRDGVFAPHQRGYNARVREGCADTFQIARASGVAVHISHLGVNEDAQRALDGAAREGIDVTFDMYPYAAACTHLLMMLPEWAQAGGHAAAMARLHDPSRRLLEETARRLEERGEVILAAVEGGPELEGRVLSDLATTAGMAPAAYLAELLASHGGRALAVYRWPERVDGEAVLRATLTHPLFIGGSDGILRGSHPHPRGFGTFPRIVGDHVRAGTLPLEEAVHKVTGRPARRFGIRERGEMREGWYADLTVFDPGLLADLATYADGGKAPAGVTHVAVNGDLVLQDGRPTGTLPGRLLRK